ncbi:MAG TPA: Wzy polymerase domain-containing protein [Scandinavium sp.]|uniref:O-antigen ligase family protein n=1 Tax=Scandinavium sp. TaxID=2830653 RepID=UPI002E35CC93|nr:Wzy polymerase domain-containing protein [Scandinavium sp.]HEX4502393.1 Wzy polymerase domain-containing protein [Scandinavium sp.]
MLFIYISNAGGSGVSLPYNLMLICWVGVIIIFLSLDQKLNVYARPQFPLITVGGSALIIPGLIKCHNSPVVWVLLIVFLLWYGLSCLVLKSEHKRFILLSIFILALNQAAIGLIQSFTPKFAAHLFEYDWLRNNGRPYGIFQQVNLFASFLASGIGCGFLLLFMARNRGHVLGCTVGLGLLAFALALNQSRAGEIGAGVVVLALAGVYGRETPKKTITALAVIIVSFAAGAYITQHMIVMINGQPYLMARDYDGSTYERWHILQITWQMIMQKPWLGWGYGSFEYEFSRYMLAHPTLPRVNNIITHPHNELLYAWYQGGIVALSGMLVLFMGWLKIVIRAWKQQRDAVGYTLLIIPLLVHLNLEYPFYQSWVHLGLFLLLLRLGDSEKQTIVSNVTPLVRATRMCFMLSGILLLAFGAISFYAQQQLTYFERHQYENFPKPSPWYFSTQFERAKFDAMTALLIDYNHTHDDTNLDKFMAQAEQWSFRHNDKNVWQSMLMIEQFRGHTQKAAQLRMLYTQLFLVSAKRDE